MSLRLNFCSSMGVTVLLHRLELMQLLSCVSILPIEMISDLFDAISTRINLLRFPNLTPPSWTDISNPSFSLIRLLIPLLTALFSSDYTLVCH